LADLLTLCKDDNCDVVLKAIAALTEVFVDILPSYRIREYNEEDDQKLKEGKEKSKKDNHKISKEIQ